MKSARRLLARTLWWFGDVLARAALAVDPDAPTAEELADAVRKTARRRVGEVLSREERRTWN